MESSSGKTLNSYSETRTKFWLIFSRSPEVFSFLPPWSGPFYYLIFLAKREIYRKDHLADTLREENNEDKATNGNIYNGWFILAIGWILSTKYFISFVFFADIWLLTEISTDYKINVDF